MLRRHVRGKEAVEEKGVNFADHELEVMIDQYCLGASVVAIAMKWGKWQLQKVTETVNTASSEPQTLEELKWCDSCKRPWDASLHTVRGGEGLPVHSLPDERFSSWVGTSVRSLKLTLSQIARWQCPLSAPKLLSYHVAQPLRTSTAPKCWLHLKDSYSPIIQEDNLYLRIWRSHIYLSIYTRIIIIIIIIMHSDKHIYRRR